MNLHLYMYTSTYLHTIYTHVCLFVCVYTCEHIYRYIYKYIHIHILYVYVCLCVCVCVFVFVRVCEREILYLCVYVWFERHFFTSASCEQNIFCIVLNRYQYLCVGVGVRLYVCVLECMCV